MRTFLVYLKLELKRALRILPWTAAGAMVLAGLLGAIALFAVRTLEGGEELNKLKVGVILPEEDALAKKVVSMLGSLESVENICQFVFVGLEEGQTRMKDGELACLMAVPDNFVGSIIDGSNKPVTILFDGPLGVEEQIFKELTEAGAETLSSAQAGIYAANRMHGLYGIPADIQEAENYLNARYLGYSMDRSIHFRSLRVLAAGDIPLAYHYAAAGMVFLLLFSGIPASRLFAGESQAKREKLYLLGIRRGGWTAGKAAAMMALLLAALATVAAVIAAAVQTGIFSGEEIIKELTEKSRGTMLYRTILFTGILFTASSLIVLCYSLSGTGLGGMMLLFLGSCIMMVFSGGVLPQVFLPESFRTAAACLPTTLLMDGVKQFFQSGSDWKLLAALLGTGLAALTAAGLLKEGRQ